MTSDEKNQAKGWILTYTGRRVWPLNLQSEDIDIRDIAHALAGENRWTSQSREWFSVGQHSLLVSEKVPSEFALWGLLHDASEAYLRDLPKPLKDLPEAQWYRDAEERAMKAICERFWLPLEMPQEVADADRIMAATERRDFIVGNFPDWEIKLSDGTPAKPYPEKLHPLTPGMVEKLFLDQFKRLVPPLFG